MFSLRLQDFEVYFMILRVKSKSNKLIKMEAVVNWLSFFACLYGAVVLKLALKKYSDLGLSLMFQFENVFWCNDVWFANEL